MPRVLLTEAGYAEALGNYVSTPRQLSACCSDVPLSSDTDCCHDCHFRYEERFAFPHLPPWARRSLQREHARLRKTGYPPAAVRRHIAKEMRLYRRFVPRGVVGRIDADHQALGADDDVGALHEKMDALIKRQRSVELWTRYGTYATIAAVIVGAARMGLIAVPFIQAARDRR